MAKLCWKLKWHVFFWDTVYKKEKRSHFNFPHNFTICWDISTIFEAFCSGTIYAWQSVAYIRKCLFMWY